jgi:site-specific recombinase XerD
MSLELLSGKVAVLLALTTGHRIQTLTAINIQNIEKKNNQIEIKIPAQLKTSGPKKLQPNLIVPFFSDDPTICVASALETYLKRTSCLRKDINILFISRKKPYKAITSQSLSRWIKHVLQKSGIDTSMFTAYSTRHASTSAVKRKGINIDLIKKHRGLDFIFQNLREVL